MVWKQTVGHQSLMSPARDKPRDELVTPERSMFGTRLPRPTGVGKHLLVVLVITGFALVAAVIFAEQSTAPVTNERQIQPVK
jgi:hypothetical protein